MPGHGTDATPAERKALSAELRDLIGDGPLPRCFLDVLKDCALTTAKGLRHMLVNEDGKDAFHDVWEAINWNTAGSARKKATAADKLRIKSLVRGIIGAASDAGAAGAATGSEADAGSSVREINEYVADPIIDDKVKARNEQAFQRVYKYLPQAIDRPHQRVAGKVQSQVKRRHVTLYPLAKVFSEEDEPTVRPIKAPSGAEVEQIAEDAVAGFGDFLRRLWLLLLAYVLAAAPLQEDGEDWCSYEAAYTYMVFIRRKAAEPNVDFNKLVKAERATRATWGDRIAHSGDTLGAAMSECPDKAGRFWHDISKPAPALKRAGDPGAPPPKKPKGAGKGGGAAPSQDFRPSRDTLCGDWNGRGCSRSDCKFAHRCSVPGCGSTEHPATQHRKA